MSENKSNMIGKYEIRDNLDPKGFGEVYLGYDTVEHKEVSIKKIKRSLYSQDSIFEEELSQIKSLKSPFTTDYFDLVCNDEYYFIISELCDENLYKFIEKNSNLIDENFIREILIQLNQVFYILKEKNILYKNINPENILVKYHTQNPKYFKIKISNFGLTKSTNPPAQGYIAPEIINAEDQEKAYLKAKKSDLWSLGVTLYYIVFKFVPFANFYRDVIPKKCQNVFLNDLISRLIISDEKKRLSWDEYFEHPFFKDEKSLYNILCKEHSRNYYAYCSVCKCNICELCNHSSNSHNIIPFTELELNQNKISQTINNKKIIERINQLNEENEYLYNIIKENEKIYFDGLSEEENDLYSDNSIIIKENKSSLDLIKLNIAAKCCCRIEYIKSKEKFIGNGFLIQFFLKNSTNLIKGLMTTNNFINENIIKENIELFIYFNLGKQTIRLNMKNHFIFSDSFINITFIKLNNNDINNKDINFLIIDENKEEISDQIILIKNKFDGSLSFLEGKIISQWGFELYHSISSKYYGSALIERNTNKIISILTPKKSNTKYYPSINIKFIIKAINSIYINKDDIMVISKAKKLSKNEIKELNNKGLKNTQSDYIFESESSHFVTPLWFYRTNHNWYWTPVNPKINKKNALPSNWLIIYPKGSLKVIGGYWKGQEPAPINIDLIHWLESNGYKYLV